ncbi:hypothetical protein QQS21_007905 [Conoideocrella luteorostrata]|uniref:Uncharacterized protein n=1 Tax=Conoideocrella luteorostrata TaxID=1105319 RepID=A0AAJ0CK11_9HYPO|nr:hypothetical protein QQS21_007905 [Conoideocrella luteorostrata]
MLSMSNRQKPFAFYSPQIYECVIKLTLGKGDYIYYGKDETGKEVFITGTDNLDGLSISHACESLSTKLEPSPSQVTSTACAPSQPAHEQANRVIRSLRS